MIRRMSLPLRVFLLCWTAVFLGSGCAHRAGVQPATDLASPGASAEPVEFVFGPGDEIDISVWRHEDLNMRVKVAPDGTISYPLLGHMQIGGMTYPQLKAVMEEKIAVYYVEPQVSINVHTVASMKVFVLGYVRTPQILQIESGMTVVEALTRAGWVSDDSRTDNILLIRGGLTSPKLFSINLDEMLNAGDTRQNVALQKDDVLYVPAKTIANVEKFFRRIAGIISPFVSGTVVYRNIQSGGSVGTSSALDN